MNRWTVAALSLALILPIWTATVVHAQEGFVDENGDGIDDASAFMHRRGWDRHRMRGMRGGALEGDVLWTSTALTDEQQAAVKAKMDELRTAGATFEEMRAGIAEVLAGYGIAVSDETPWRVGRGGLWMEAELTDEQQAAIKAKVEELKAEGATYDAIHTATAELLATYGYTVSDDASWRLSYSPFARLSMRLGDVLTEDQLAGLEAKIEELKAQDLSPQEMRDAVNAELVALGVDIPDRPEAGPGPRMGHRGGGRGGARGHR